MWISEFLLQIQMVYGRIKDAKHFRVQLQAAGGL
jgi:hypothetical protein